MTHVLLQPERVAGVLGQLPTFEPDPALWSRIAAAREGQLRQRRRRRLIGVTSGFATAAVLLVAVLIGAPADPIKMEATADWQAQARALELRWQGQSEGSALHPAQRLQLQSIDRALQAAYDRGEGDEQLSMLWQARSEALSRLLAGDRASRTLIRI